MSHRHDHAGVISFANGCEGSNAPFTIRLLLGQAQAEGVVVSPPVPVLEREGTSRRPVTVIWRKPGVLGVRFDEYFSRR